MRLFESVFQFLFKQNDEKTYHDQTILINIYEVSFIHISTPQYDWLWQTYALKICLSDTTINGTQMIV